MLKKIVKLLNKYNLTISTIESCTSGAIAAKLTSLEGASKYFYGSMVTYATDCKINQLGIDSNVIKKHDVVSAQVALLMANKGRDFFKTDICLSITGYIGNSKDVKYPGCVWICSNIKGITDTYLMYVEKDRLKNRKLCVKKALEYLYDRLCVYDCLKK